MLQRVYIVVRLGGIIRTGDEGKEAKRIRAARVMLEGWRGGIKAGGRLRLGQSKTRTTATEWVAKQEDSLNCMSAISFFPYTHTLQ